MADKQSEQASREEEPESGYEIDLDDTISAWDQVVQQAVAAVDSSADPSAVEPVMVGDVAEGEDLGKMEDVRELEDLPEVEDAPEAENQAGDEASERPIKGIEVVEPVAAKDEDSTEAKNLREQLMRTLADFDNFRKRADREKASMKRYALFDVLKDFLGVHDNLERALAASGSAEDLKTGVEMIARQFIDLMRRYGVEPVEAMGQTFDPMIHEAVMREEGSDIEEPTVTSELQRGYQLHDRLLRPAMVSVKMPAPRPKKEAEASSEQEAEADVSDEGGNNEEVLGEEVAQAS